MIIVAVRFSGIALATSMGISIVEAQVTGSALSFTIATQAFAGMAFVLLATTVVDTWKKAFNQDSKLVEVNLKIDTLIRQVNKIELHLESSSNLVQVHELDIALLKSKGPK